MATRQEREAKRRAHEAEILKKLAEVNAKKDPDAPRKGRSSKQGVKLMYIRDYLRENTNKDHPKNAIEISQYLAGQGIKADRKTIYNDIERLIGDFKEPIEYTSGKKRGYYISEPQFEPYELRLLVDCIRTSSSPTREEAEALTGKIQRIANVYDRQALHIYPLIKEINRPKESIAQNVSILYQAIAQKRKVSFSVFNRVPSQKYKTKNVINKQNATETFILSPREIIWSNGTYILRGYLSDELQNWMCPVERLHQIKILPMECEQEQTVKRHTKEQVQMYRNFLEAYIGKEQVITICIKNSRVNSVLNEFGEDALMVPLDENHFTINIKRRKIQWPELFGWIAGLNGEAWITQPQEAIDGMNTFLSRLLEIYAVKAGNETPPPTE